MTRYPEISVTTNEEQIYAMASLLEAMVAEGENKYNICDMVFRCLFGRTLESLVAMLRCMDGNTAAKKNEAPHEE